jgi:hypothetical protein
MPSSPTILTQQMTYKLLDLLHDYQDKCELNESTYDHIDHAIYFLCRHENDLNHYGLRQYKFDLSLALQWHKDNIESYTKHTYTKLTKAISAIEPFLFF